MSEIVGRLCREHRNIGALLDMLERMLDGLESASDAGQPHINHLSYQ